MRNSSQLSTSALTTKIKSWPKAFLFQTYSRATGQLTGNLLPQSNAYAMIQRRAKSAGITTRVGKGYFSTTSGNITDDVILQYLQEHEPTGVSR